MRRQPFFLFYYSFLTSLCVLDSFRQSCEHAYWPERWLLVWWLPRLRDQDKPFLLFRCEASWRLEGRPPFIRKWSDEDLDGLCRQRAQTRGLARSKSPQTLFRRERREGGGVSSNSCSGRAKGQKEEVERNKF